MQSSDHSFNGQPSTNHAYRSYFHRCVWWMAVHSWDCRSRSPSFTYISSTPLKLAKTMKQTPRGLAGSTDCCRYNFGRVGLRTSYQTVIRSFAPLRIVTRSLKRVASTDTTTTRSGLILGAMWRQAPPPLQLSQAVLTSCDLQSLYYEIPCITL